jgi:hypothetical protein
MYEPFLYLLLCFPLGMCLWHVLMWIINEHDERQP